MLVQTSRDTQNQTLFPNDDLPENKFKYKWYAKKYDQPLWKGIPRKLIVIAATPRSGSTLLNLGLATVGVIPYAVEFFSYYTSLGHNSGHDLALRWGKLSKGYYLKKCFSHRTTPDGIFGVKAHFEQFREFFPYLPKSTLCYYINTRRKNIILQAVSLYIASITDSFISTVKKKIQPSEENYDFYEILKKLEYILNNDKQWDMFYEQNNITPLETVYYETLSAHYPEVIASLATKISGRACKRSQILPPRYISNPLK
jgi:LPS sulfotransferase NodH